MCSPPLIAIAFIDRLGRRKLLLTGLIGMGISLVVVGTAFRFIVPRRLAATAAPTGAGIVTLLALVCSLFASPSPWGRSCGR